MEIWTAKDEEGSECSLDRVGHDVWQWSMTEGRWSGYPTINLGPLEMMQLRDAIDQELCRREQPTKLDRD